MITNEKTTYQGMEHQKEQKVKASVKQGSASASWKKVSVSGVTGILIGAGAMYAANTMAEKNATGQDVTPGEVEDNHTSSSSNLINGGIPVAVVNDEMSFGEAFASAREQVGAGGVFEWHGNVYSTYLADEWDSMSNTDRTVFANSVVGHHETPAKPEPEPVVIHSDTPEVHFLGVESFDSDGQKVSVGRMTVDEQNVWLVDVDEDEVFDIAMSDRNKNGQIDDDEVQDISNSNITIEQFAEAVIEDGNASGNEHYYANNEDNIDGGNMPDYIDDADLHTI